MGSAYNNLKYSTATPQPTSSDTGTTKQPNNTYVDWNKFINTVPSYKQVSPEDWGKILQPDKLLSLIRPTFKVIDPVKLFEVAMNTPLELQHLAATNVYHATDKLRGVNTVKFDWKHIVAGSNVTANEPDENNLAESTDRFLCKGIGLEENIVNSIVGHMPAIRRTSCEFKKGGIDFKEAVEKTMVGNTKFDVTDFLRNLQSCATNMANLLASYTHVKPEKIRGFGLTPELIAGVDKWILGELAKEHKPTESKDKIPLMSALRAYVEEPSDFSLRVGKHWGNHFCDEHLRGGGPSGNENTEKKCIADREKLVGAIVYQTIFNSVRAGWFKDHLTLPIMDEEILTEIMASDPISKRMVALDNSLDTSRRVSSQKSMPAIELF